MKNRDNYRDFRNEYIKRLSLEWDFSAKKKITLFKRFVSIWINFILWQNKNLSKDDFLFLKMRNYDLEVFWNILKILKEQNYQKNEIENKDICFHLDNFISELHHLFYQINTRNLDSYSIFLSVANNFKIYIESIVLDINKPLNKQKKSCDKIWEFEIEKIRKIAKILYPYFFKNWNNYLWKKFLFFLWDKNEAKRVLSKRKLYFPGWIDYTDADIYEMILDYSTKSEKRLATEKHIRQDWLGYPFFDMLPFFKKKIRKINSELERYCKKYNIPYKQLLNAESLNMAVETLRNRYDLVIWILGSGTGVAALHEICGRNVGYMEWHKNWKKEAIWKNIGENKFWKMQKNPKKILVCEHDTSTGATLAQLKEKFEKLYPESEVDICFLYDFWKNSDFVHKTWFFKKCINPKETRQIDFFDNIEILYKIVSSKEFKEKL